MLKPLADLLPGSLQRTGAKRSVDATMIVETTRPMILQIIPELRPSDFEVVSYRDGTITIAVANPTISQELRLRTEPILEALADAFPSHPMKHLKFIALIEREEEG